MTLALVGNSIFGYTIEGGTSVQVRESDLSDLERFVEQADGYIGTGATRPGRPPLEGLLPQGRVGNASTGTDCNQVHSAGILEMVHGNGWRTGEGNGHGGSDGTGTFGDGGS